MRRTLIIIITLLLAAVLVLPGCGGGQKMVTVTSPAGTEVKIGQEFTVILDSNRTTGYQWQLAKPLNETVVKLVSSEYRVPDTSLVGAGGKEVWTFRAAGSGEAGIVLKYVRPWEKDVSPAKEQTFTVTVK